MTNKSNFRTERSPTLRSALDKLLGADKTSEDAGIADAKDAFNDVRNFLRDRAISGLTKADIQKSESLMSSLIKKDHED